MKWIDQDGFGLVCEIWVDEVRLCDLHISSYQAVGGTMYKGRLYMGREGEFIEIAPTDDVVEAKMLLANEARKILMKGEGIIDDLFAELFKERKDNQPSGDFN